MLRPALVSLSLSLLVFARLHHSLVPEDPFAFPKYRVSFLNGLPLLNETAQRWLHDGLRGGDLEFFGQPWADTPSPASIEGSDDGPSNAAAPSSASPRLKKMKLGPKSEFLCLIPQPRPAQESTVVVEEAATEVVTPVHSWSLLQPLSGKCLYHRQGWFTYSYCHNSHVRQFHELHQQHIPSTGEYKPEEDPEWEAYTLGRAPATVETGAELRAAEDAAAAAANLELARAAGSRYLVQRWADGTYCDKTGRKREVEIQFHCSMTMTDTILFVKETQTCHYVLHIATPRLCGEPGFKTRLDAEEEHAIRCREIVPAADLALADATLPAAAYPSKRPKAQKKDIAPPPPAPADGSDKGTKGAKKAAGEVGLPPEVLRAALEKVLAQREGARTGEDRIYVDENAEYVLEYVDIELDVPKREKDKEDEGRPLLRRAGDDETKITVRSMGFDLKKNAGGQSEDDEQKGEGDGEESEGKGEGKRAEKPHDEL